MVHHRLAYLTEMQGIREESYLKILKKHLIRFFEKSITNGSYFGVIAEINNKAAGYGGMVIRHIPGDLNKPFYLEADILNMYTLPEFRRMGVGQAIVKAIEKEAVILGISKLTLHTSKDGEKLYRSSGFSEPAFPFLEKIL
jgi:GNAT superfamily N-acetyltransferase